MNCAVVNCSSTNSTPDVIFHRFPTDNQILHVWIAATGKPNFVPKDNSKICSKHFLKSEYIRPKFLKADAIPTEHLGDCEQLYTKRYVPTENCNKIIPHPNNPLTTILDNQSEISDIQVNKTSSNANVSSTTSPVSAPQLSRILNVVPNGNLIFGPNSIQLNVLPLTTVPVSLVQFPGGGIGQPAHQLDVNALSAIGPVSHASLSTPVFSVRNTVNHYDKIKPTFTLPSATKPSTGVCEYNRLSAPLGTVRAASTHSDSLGAIKVVDVNKLLQPPRNFQRKEENISVNSNKFLEHAKVGKPESSSAPDVVKPADNEAPLKEPSDIKVSHVLKCLKVILPDNFDLSRLIPNEKVARLIIRYLKLTDSVSIQTVVKSSLEIIVKASKSEIKVFGDYNKHPYTNIKPLALQVALAQLLPANFSMLEVTDTLLNCLCIILNQDIYTDGFPIIRGKMFNFSNDNLQYQKSQDDWSNNKNSFSGHDSRPVINSSRNEAILSEDNSNDSMYSEENCNYSENINTTKELSPLKEKCNNTDGSKRYRKVTVKRKSYYVGTVDNDCDDPSYCPDESIPTKQSKLNAKIKYSRNQRQGLKDFENDLLDPYSLDDYFFRSIVNFIHVKECTAQDVLVSFKLMFHLCRYLNLKSRQSNLVKLRGILRVIVEKNINLSNVDNYAKNTLKSKYSSSNLKPNGAVDKLRLDPVVVLSDLVDYSKEQIKFLSTNKKPHKILNKGDNHHDSYPQSLEKTQLMPNHSSEQVRRLTGESYKEFRKIIMKRNDNKVVFRLKYKELRPGTKVFVKDFQRRSFGYLQGTVSRRNGPISYLVKLENGEKRNCVVDHLRPDFGHVYSSRAQRLIKPKQLFDL